MKQTVQVLLVVFVFFFSGCPARSLNGLFTEEEVIFNPALVGTWFSDESSLTFAKGEKKSYRVVHKDIKSNDSLMYIAQLGKLGELWFIDSYPAEYPQDDHFVPAHMITKIWFDKNQLFLATLDSDWLIKMFESNRLKISHVRRGSEIILTASTATLQQLATKFGNNKEAFPVNGKPFKKK